MFAIPPCYNAGDTVYLPFPTFDSDGASITITGLATTDIEVYNVSTWTVRSSDNGYALVDTDGTDVGGHTGIHGFSIDTGDNSHAGFWADGTTYWVIVDAITVDSQTVRFVYLLPLGYLLRPTTAGRKLTVESDGVAHADVKEWLGVAPLALSSQQVQAVVPDSQKVDVNTMKTQAITCGAGVTVGVYVGGTAAHATAAELAKVPKSDGSASWNSTALAAIQSECNDALVALNLDHVLKVALADDGDIVDDTAFAQLMASDGDFTGYSKATDSQEALRDNIAGQCVVALGAYDAPTNTDLGNRTLAAPDYFDPANDTVVNVTTVATVTNGVTLASGEDVYHADIQLTVDGTNSKDEYTVVWFKNGVRVTSGITVPKIQVIKRADGTDLVAQTAMTQSGSTGIYKYDESTNRVTAGEAVVAVMTATIDGSSRTWPKVLTRDSSS